MIYKEIDNKTILVSNIKYNKVAERYRILKSIEFGEDKDVEKECNFIDYESEEGKLIVSFAVLKENNEKADIIVEIISINEIEFGINYK